MIKRILKIVLFILCIVVLLNFIPVKFAVKTDVNDKENAYLCSYSTATDGNWYAPSENNKKLPENLYLNVNANNSFKNLKEIHNIWSTGLILNRYVFYGSVYEKSVDDDFVINCIDVENWDIVYPIRRDSIRDLFTPRNYLTVYDYIWNGF